MPRLTQIAAVMVVMLVMLVMVLSPAAAARDGLPDEAAKLAQLDAVTRTVVKTLPVEWQVQRAGAIPTDQIAAIRERLGVSFDGLANAVFTVYGKPIQINVITTSSEAEARAVVATMRRFRGGDAEACIQVGTNAVEFVGDNRMLYRRAKWDLELRPRPEVFRYEISFDAAPMSGCDDYMKWNALFNAILQADRSEDPDAADRVAGMLTGFTPGDRLVLRTAGDDVGSYAFVPAPVRRMSGGTGDTTAFLFEALPRRHGLPVVGVRATVQVVPDPQPGEAPDAALTEPTRAWPCDDPAIIQLAERITDGAATPGERVDALLAWLLPGKKIRYSGGVTGSRYGVPKVLQQRFGHCWDFADCFVTMCRALDIPAREVMGWLYGGEGHVWAEVYVEGFGWRQVDATGGGVLSCYPYHIPFVTSEDGEMTLMYLQMPEIVIKGDARTVTPD